MTESLLKLATKFGKTLIVLGLVAVLHALAAAQVRDKDEKSVPPKPLTEMTKADDSKELFSPVEEEMRAKRAIQADEKEYRENLGRARDLSLLGGSIVASFKQKKSLDQEDIKKLEKVEKLAKGIRRAAGGCDDDVEMEKPPKDLATAIEMLSELSQSLKVKVEKTPKHVISASVIDEANVLLELIRIVRSLPAKV